MPYPLIPITATDQASLALRRYAMDACAGNPYGAGSHDARTLIGTAPVVVLDERGTWDVEMETPAPTDPRWPPRCACGYVFLEADVWQLSRDRLYARPDSDARLTLHEVTPGMLWDAPWYIDEDGDCVGPDGRSLVVRLPDGTNWAIDAPSTHGAHWTRLGTPPLISATPSILSTRYHGWLRNGVLSDDLGGRSYG